MKFPFIDKLIESGGECFLCGGAIRDELVGREPTDFDFIVRCLPVEKIQSVCSEFGNALMHKYISGAIRLHTSEFGIVDISTPRVSQGIYLPYGSMAEHFRFVDFTMNCIYRNMKTLDMYNPYKGVEDIQRKRIVLNPNMENLSEAPMLPLRAARFMGIYGFDIDDRTRNIFHRDKEMMFDTIPMERLRYEMYRILTSENYKAGIPLLEELNILKRLFEIYNTP